MGYIRRNLQFVTDLRGLYTRGLKTKQYSSPGYSQNTDFSIDVEINEIPDDGGVDGPLLPFLRFGIPGSVRGVREEEFIVQEFPGGRRQSSVVVIDQIEDRLAVFRRQNVGKGSERQPRVTMTSSFS